MSTKPPITRNVSCCFSGYRPEKLPWGSNENDDRCRALKIRMYAELEGLYGSGIRHFICGMARGSDMYFCEAALRLRASRPDVTIEAAIPCEEQAARWSESDRNRYFSLLSQCDFETYVNRRYTRDCMTRRNKYMVNSSSVLLAVYDGKFGGTMYTLGYAHRNGLTVIELNP